MNQLTITLYIEIINLHLRTIESVGFMQGDVGLFLSHVKIINDYAIKLYNNPDQHLHHLLQETILRISQVLDQAYEDIGHLVLKHLESSEG